MQNQTGAHHKELIRSLGTIPSTAIVIGSVIGTGVFLKCGGMAQLTGSISWVMFAWVLAGVLSLTGALAYSELGVRFPRAGGEYVYLYESFGPFAAFLYGWTRFWIAGPASIAAYSVGSATFLAGIWLPTDAVTRAVVSLRLVSNIFNSAEDFYRRSTRNRRNFLWRRKSGIVCWHHGNDIHRCLAWL